MNVLVIQGGNSSEREISLLSGQNVGKSLTVAGHTVTYFDPAVGLELLDQALQNIDVVFPILHGTGGEDGQIQQHLEQAGVAFVGSGSVVSKNCFDKWQTIQLAKNVLFPKTELVSKESIQKSDLLKKPYVIKPRAEGSSVDTFLVRDPATFDVSTLDGVFKKYNNELLLEELIEGQEITVGILGQEPLPVVEIIPPNGQEFDFVNKYNGATSENCPPLYVDKALQQQAQAIAKELHMLLGCRDFSRTDFIIDKTNRIYTLEINTLPGMTPQSLLPKSAKAAGYSIEDFVDQLVKNAYERH